MLDFRVWRDFRLCTIIPVLDVRGCRVLRVIISLAYLVQNEIRHM